MILYLLLFYNEKTGVLLVALAICLELLLSKLYFFLRNNQLQFVDVFSIIFVILMAFLIIKTIYILFNFDYVILISRRFSNSFMQAQENITIKI